MNKTDVIVCPFCMSKNIKITFVHDMFGYIDAGHVRCHDCKKLCYIEGPFEESEIKEIEEE